MQPRQPSYASDPNLAIGAPNPYLASPAPGQFVVAAVAAIIGYQLAGGIGAVVGGGIGYVVGAGVSRGLAG